MIFEVRGIRSDGEAMRAAQNNEQKIALRVRARFLKIIHYF